MAGEDHTHEIPAGPSSAKAVVALGTQYDSRKEGLGHHCGENCETHAYIYSYIYNQKYDACGGNGGNGGNAGKGGTTAYLRIYLKSGEVKQNLVERPGSGGLPGKGGLGAKGISSDIDYFGERRENEDAGCHGFLGWDCDIHIGSIQYQGYHISNHDKSCNGRNGMDGK